MRTIIVLVGVAITVFLLFTTYSVQKSIEGSAELSKIKDLYFPVLERTDANIVRLDKMEQAFTQAVMTAERDQVSQAADFQHQADAALAEIEQLYPERSTEVAALRSEFRNYGQLATAASNALLDKTSSDIAGQTAGMNQALEHLRTDIRQFRQSSYENFVHTLQQSQRDARTNLYMGLAIGVMNLGFMGVLVFFIRNNVKMMALVAEQNATLELRVNERTAQLTQKTNDIAAMLQNMKLGVCTVVPGNRIHPEYSAHLATLAEQDALADRDVVDILFARSDLGDDRKDQINVALGSIVGEDAMMFDFNSHLLPAEITLATREGESRIVQLAWNPIVNASDTVDKVLLIMQDVTHLRALEREAAAQGEELDLIARILQVAPGKFNEFIDSARVLAAENRELIEAAQGVSVELVAALFRNMHTIKGNARTYNFSLITDAAHQAEQTYDGMRKAEAPQWAPQVLLAELAAVEDALNRHLHVNQEKLGRGGRAGEHFTSRGAFVTSDDLERLDVLARATGSGAAAELAEFVARIGLVPLERLVSGATDAVPGLARELGKPVPQVRIEDGDVGFNSGFAEALKRSLVHIVRNSLDHGIERPEDRVRAGKPEQGVVSFATRRHDDHIELSIGDDGRGLPLHLLYGKGVEAGLFQPGVAVAPEDVAELIFRSGLSTARDVTQVSGRGVGMDAVRTFLAEQGADIRIALESPGTPPTFTPFRFVIRIPLSCCSR